MITKQGGKEFLGDAFASRDFWAAALCVVSFTPSYLFIEVHHG